MSCNSLFTNVDPVQELTVPSNLNLQGKLRLKCVDNTILLINNSFYQLTNKEWENEHAPFSNMVGQSFESFSKGFVIFGGQNNEKKLTNHMWIRKLNGTWVPIFNHIEPRKHHAAIYIDDLDSVLIVGGKNNSAVFDDMILIDITTLETKVFTPEKKLKLYKHSMTYMGNKKVCIFGGFDDEKIPNKKIYILDLETKGLDEIKTFMPFEPSHSSQLDYLSGMLIYSDYESKEFWAFDLPHKIWLKLDISKVLPEVKYLFLNENGFTLLNESLTNKVIVHYDDINLFKEKLLKLNIELGVYDFNKVNALYEYYDYLNEHGNLLLNLKIILKNAGISHFDESSYEEVDIKKAYIKLIKSELKLKELKPAKKDNNKYANPDHNKTKEIVNDLNNLRQSLITERKNYNNNAKNYYTNLSKSIYYQINYAKREQIPNLSESTLDLTEKSNELTEKIKKQDDEIKELTEQLENEKSKIGEYYDSLIKLTDQVELTYQAYNKEENTTAEKLKEFCDEKIKFNNFNFKSILQKNSISKADEMVTKKNFASDENQRLSHQLLVLKRNKNTIMKQLQEDIDNLIKKEIKIKREGEVACRKVRTDLFELAMWVNESAQNNGANYLIDRISYDLSGVQTEFPQMKSGSNSKKTQRRRSSIFTSSNVMIHNWFSLQKDIIQTFEKLEKICNI